MTSGQVIRRWTCDRCGCNGEIKINEENWKQSAGALPAGWDVVHVTSRVGVVGAELDLCAPCGDIVRHELETIIDGIAGYDPSEDL